MIEINDEIFLILMVSLETRVKLVEVPHLLKILQIFEPEEKHTHKSLLNIGNRIGKIV